MFQPDSDFGMQPVRQPRVVELVVSTHLRTARGANLYVEKNSMLLHSNPQKHSEQCFHDGTDDSFLRF